MFFRSVVVHILAIVVLASFASFVKADKVVLKDGTVLQGKTIPEGNGYWFKGLDGQTRHIDAADISTVEKVTPVKSGAEASESHPRLGPSVAFVKTKAEASENAAAAVAVWQQFIDSKPSGPDLKSAQDELTRWQKMQGDGAERIKGKWMAGADRNALIEKFRKLHDEGLQLLKSNQTLQAIKKLEEAQALYPNSFQAAFQLGYIYTLQKDDPKALGYLDQALKLQPNSPEALGNVALCQFHKKQYLESVMTLYKAAQNGDTPEIAQDLVTMLTKISPSQRDSQRLKPAVDASNLMIAKYKIAGPGPLFLVPLRPKLTSPGIESPGGTYSGTGFVISPDGLILTNRHVAEKAKTLMVVLDGKTQRPAQVVNIDDEQDLALIQVKTDAPLPFVRLSVADAPAPGAECTVMGFPMIDRLGANIKITRGIVASKASLDGADVMIDAKVNPGNSGGPILDQNGNVMAIVCMKSVSNAMEDSYGLAISAGQIRKFLAKNHVQAPTGEPAALALTTEQIAAKVTPAAVCILSTR
jgi:S1-C subfamily serine protease